MVGKVIQISSLVTPAGVALYALTDAGYIYERIIGRRDASWVQIAG